MLKIEHARLMRRVVGRGIHDVSERNKPYALREHRSTPAADFRGSQADDCSSAGLIRPFGILYRAARYHRRKHKTRCRPTRNRTMYTSSCGALHKS